MIRNRFLLAAFVVGMGGTVVDINGDKIAGTLFFGTLSGGLGSVLTSEGGALKNYQVDNFSERASL